MGVSNGEPSTEQPASSRATLKQVTTTCRRVREVERIGPSFVSDERTKHRERSVVKKGSVVKNGGAVSKTRSGSEIEVSWARSFKCSACLCESLAANLASLVVEQPLSVARCAIEHKDELWLGDFGGAGGVGVLCCHGYQYEHGV